MNTYGVVGVKMHRNYLRHLSTEAPHAHGLTSLLTTVCGQRMYVVGCLPQQRIRYGVDAKERRDCARCLSAVSS